MEQRQKWSRWTTCEPAPVLKRKMLIIDGWYHFIHHRLSQLKTITYWVNPWLSCTAPHCRSTISEDRSSPFVYRALFCFYRWKHIWEVQNKIELIPKLTLHLHSTPLFRYTWPINSICLFIIVCFSCPGLYGNTRSKRLWLLLFLPKKYLEELIQWRYHFYN